MGTRPAMYDRRNLQSGPSNNKRRFCTEYKCYLQRHQEIKKNERIESQDAYYTCMYQILGARCPMESGRETEAVEDFR